jgi:hypothetical protein
MALKVSFNTSPDGSTKTVKFWGWILMAEYWVECQMQYFVEANAIAVRRVGKEDMRHIAKATGATQVRTTTTFNSSAFLIILFPISFRRPQNYHFGNERSCALSFYFLTEDDQCFTRWDISNFVSLFVCYNSQFNILRSCLHCLYLRLDTSLFAAVMEHMNLELNV